MVYNEIKRGWKALRYSGRSMKNQKNQKLDEDNSSKPLENLGAAVLEELQEVNEGDLEVFDLYTHALKSKIHIREHDFCTRIAQGYDILVENLTSH